MIYNSGAKLLAVVFVAAVHTDCLYKPL